MPNDSYTESESTERNAQLARISDANTIAFATTNNHITMLKARLQMAINHNQQNDQPNMRSLYKTFSGTQSAEPLPPRTLELQAIAPPPSQYLPYDDVTAYTPHIEGTYEEGVTEETLDTFHVVSLETETIQPIQITPPKNVVAIHTVDESSRGVYNLSNSAVKIIKDVAAFAQCKGGTSSTEGPSPFVVQQECGQAVGESEKYVSLDLRGKIIWPYSCITIEHYVSAWEQGTDKLPPVTL